MALLSSGADASTAVLPAASSGQAETLRLLLEASLTRAITSAGGARSPMRHAAVMLPASRCSSPIRLHPMRWVVSIVGRR